MTVSTVHPNYTAMKAKWEKCRDCSKDEDHIKLQGAKYLPPTSGMRADGYGVEGSEGQNAYNAYKLRAVYPEIYSEAVKVAIGVMFGKPAVIELPAVLEPMRERCNAIGDSLEGLLRKINAEQLTTGRIGLLGDISISNGQERPLLFLYNETAILNWDNASADPDENDLRYVVLDESRQVMDSNFTWSILNEYRVLALVGTSAEGVNQLTTLGKYKSGTFEEGEDVTLNLLESPNIKGSELSEIPFAFINAADLNPDPDEPPLIGLANSCLAIYRGEADYRQNLFMQGQDTLVRIGAPPGDDESVRTGAGATIDTPIGGDAKYIGVTSTGLSEQRQALETDYNRAEAKGGKLLDVTGNKQESGKALKTRVAAQTASLKDIALTGAAGLQSVLRTMATWYGADPEEVVVTPNLEFADAEINGQTLTSIMSAKGLGAPISMESIHAWMAERGLTDLTYEQETSLIAKEAPVAGVGGEKDIVGNVEDENANG